MKKKYQFGDPTHPEAKMKDFSGNLPSTDVLSFLLSPQGQSFVDQYKNAGYDVNSNTKNITFSRPVGDPDFNKYFKGFNALAQGVTGAANQLTDIKNGKDEFRQYLDSLQPMGYENYSEDGLNQNPIYTKYGGGKCMTGCGDVDHDMIHELMKAGGWIQNAVKHPGRCSNPGDSRCPEGSPQYNLAMRFKHGDLHHSKMEAGGLTKDEVFGILKSDEVKGHKLTDRQHKFFELLSKGKSEKAARAEIDRKYPKTQYGDENDMNDTPIIEAEEGEVYQTPEGQIKKISDDAPTHDEGGVIIPDAERVLENTSDLRKDKKSKALLLSPDLINMLTGEETTKSMSHAAAMDLAKEGIDNRVNKIQGKIKKNVYNLECNEKDKYATNSLKFNMMNLQGESSPNEIFDALFNHQEMVKEATGITNSKAQYGVDNAQRIHDTNGWTYLYTKDSKHYYKKQDGSIVATNGPKMSDDAWRQFLQNETPTHKSSRLSGNVNYGYTVDPSFGTNISYPQAQMADISKGFNPQVNLPVDDQQQNSFGNKYNINGSQPKSRFNEPLHWYDVAGPVQGLLEGRIPAKYNPAYLNQVRLKQQNPLPALQAGQRDYNAGLDILPQNSQGYANAANLFSKKYGLDSQILGQYENANAQTKNQETLYNSGIRDKQSLIDQQARGVFEQQRLGSLEAERQQHRTDWDSIYQTLAQNRKLNREGNLLMQLFPAFDQTGQYNGYKMQFHAPLDNGLANSGLPANTSIVTNNTTNGKPQYFIKMSDGTLKPVSFK